MSFKFIPLMLSTVLLASGCGLQVGETPAPAGEVRLEGYSCVNQISNQVKDYFAGQLNDDEIVNFVDCLKTSVSDFTKRVKPRRDFYDPEDLRAFINLISKERKLEKTLLLEFMRIKQTFVGGRVDQISRGDLASALRLLDDIKLAALILRPHVKIFNFHMESKIPPEKVGVELDQAAEALGEVSRIFVSSLKTTENNYSLKDFQNFLKELRLFINWGEVFPTAKPVEHWIELIASAKEISTDGDRYVIKRNEWGPFLNLSRSTFIIFLKIKYGIQEQNLWRSVGLKNLIHIMDQVRDDLTGVISSRKDRLIPKDEIRRLLEAVDAMNWLPLNLGASVWFNALGTFAAKILNEGTGSEFSGIRISHVLKLSGEFENWASAQSYLSSRIFPDSQGGREAPKIFLSENGSENLEDHFVPGSWREYESFILKRRPLFMPDSQAVAVAYEKDLLKLGVDFDLHNLSLTHLFYRILNLVYQSYGVRVGTSFYLSGPQLQEFYTDFFDFGVALNWLDRRSTNAGSRSYIEGNLFTYASDGMTGEYSLSLSEGVDLIAYLLSAGRLTDQIYQGLVSCARGPIDFRGEEKLSRPCASYFLAEVLPERLDFAPGLRSWLSGLSAQERVKYANLLMNSSYSVKNSDVDWVEKSELSTVSVVILYTETVLTRFDEDKNGILNDAEVNAAFPIFKEFINGLAKSITGNKAGYSDEEIKTIYKFILHKKRAPVSGGLGDSLSMFWNTPSWWNLYSEAGWVIESDRMALTESFSVIINSLLNSPPSGQK